MNNKPFELKLSEATQKLIEVVNESYDNLGSFTILELVLSNVLNTVHERAREEYENARKLYEKSTAEAEEIKENKEDA